MKKKLGVTRLLKAPLASENMTFLAYFGVFLQIGEQYSRGKSKSRKKKWKRNISVHFLIFFIASSSISLSGRLTFLDKIVLFRKT